MSLNELRARCDEFGIPVEVDTPMNQWGTFRLGGRCDALLQTRTPNELESAIRVVREFDYPVRVIGLGSNILFSDEGVRGPVIRFADAEVTWEREGENTFRVSAAVEWDELVSYAISQGRAGQTAFSGIPGTLGGAIAGNAGAWGQQVSDCLIEVRVCTLEGAWRVLSREACGFAYRQSRIKEQGWVVADALLELPPADLVSEGTERERILSLRADKHPHLDREPCIGSIFKNLEPSSAAERRQAAGYFLEQAGAKALSVGGASVYSKHANIVVKATDACEAQHVADLIRLMRAQVLRAGGPQLTREVRYLGHFDGECQSEGFH